MADRRDVSSSLADGLIRSEVVWEQTIWASPEATGTNEIPFAIASRFSGICFTSSWSLRA